MKLNGMMKFWFCLSLVLLMALPSMVLADSKFPTKPIKLVVPYSPGGGSDLSARIFAKYASRYLPEKVIVSNITGAGGVTAQLEIKRSKPDGYTLLWENQSMHMSYATGGSRNKYDIFQPIASTVKAYSAVLVPKNSPYQNVNQILEKAKANAGDLKWVAGINGPSHFAYLSIMEAAGMDAASFYLIGQAGDKNRILSMLQGNTDVSAITISSARPYLESGDLRVVGVMSEERSDIYPDLPTLAEQGINAVNRFDYTTWAPKGIPADRIKILADAWMKAANDPECRKELKSGWMMPEFMTGEKLAEFVKQQFDFYSDLAHKYNIKK